MATNSNPSLHDEMIAPEILPRLPVKSLLKFSSSSKSWHSIISGNQFTKNHLKNYSKLHKRLMLNYSGNLKHCTLESMFSNEPLFDTVDTSYLFDSSAESVSIVGSCDGLVCIAVDKKDFILWNPSTTKFKRLPSFGFDTFDSCGLGFDKRTDDYKVVVFYKDIYIGYETIIRVYSLKTNEWRTAGNFTGIVTMGDSFLFAAGKLHCVGITLAESPLELGIMSFDLATEEYGMLQVQKNVKSIKYSQLCVSEGCLYFPSTNGTNTDVWITEGYELGKSTRTKLATIPFDNILLEYVEENGEILVRSRSKFMVFNANDSKFKWLDTSMPGGPVVTYMESLVSPNV